MWLLNTLTFELKDFISKKIPSHAILSHTWGKDEVSFRDMRKDREAAKQKAGYFKIKGSCAQAQKDSLKWIWIDSCCIDKRSSAELSEAINSMFKWYQKADICYAYLADVPPGGLINPAHDQPDVSDTFSQSRWFTRGWTLQELLAPEKIAFFARDWSFLAEKVPELISNTVAQTAFVKKLASITGIAIEALDGPGWINSYSTAERMAWASRRQTTREEDVAYSIMGLFDVNMPILYGEGGAKAFLRLQKEIVSKNPDHSIFAWCFESNREIHRRGPFATKPADFANFRRIRAFAQYHEEIRPFHLTNAGLNIELPVSRVSGESRDCFIAWLNCAVATDKSGSNEKRVGIYLMRAWGTDVVSTSPFEHFMRTRCGELALLDNDTSITMKNTAMLIEEPYLVSHRNRALKPLR
jgi:hypothetical protein